MIWTKSSIGIALYRTRQHLPEEVFEQCFKRILKLCVEAGMVEGDTQAIDAAYVEANACIEHMQSKDTQLDWQKYIQVINNQDRPTTVENHTSDTLQALPKEEKRNRSNKTHATCSVIALLMDWFKRPEAD